MNLFFQGIAWIFDGANWVDGITQGLGSQLLDHLALSGLSVLLAIVVAVPLGLYIGHTGRGRRIAVPISNVTRALPTLGLLSIIVIAFNLGIGAPIIVIALLGIPPLLAGAYAGVESVDRQTVDAARAVGMTEWQILFRVELPLGASLLVGGLRSAVLQIIATATIAFYFGYDSLGSAIISGVSTANYVEMIGGSVVVTVLALVIDLLFGVAQRFAVPRGVSRGNGGSTTTDSTKRQRNQRQRLATPNRTPIPEGN